jgi:hypothetical protein
MHENHLFHFFERTMTPTEQAYVDELQKAYDFFYAKLFGGRLPGCLFSLEKKANSKGYYHDSIYKGAGDESTDKFAMNPALFSDIRKNLSTLAH